MCQLRSVGNRSLRGFTVIEVMISTFLALLLLTALLRFLVVGYPISRITLLQVNSNEAARLQLKRLSKELRKIRYSDAGAFALAEISPQRIIFYANVDSDPETERVRYELVGTTLERGVVNPSLPPIVYDENTESVKTVARAIRNDGEAIFTYYDGDYPDSIHSLTAADITAVKYIEFYLKIDADENVDPTAVDIRSQVQLRNLKTNLGQTTDPEL